MQGVRVNWNDEWIAENYLSYPSYKEMQKDYNRIFSTDVSVSGIKRHAQKLGIKKPKQYTEYTESEIEFLKEYYPKHGVKKTTTEFNKRFNANRTEHNIKNVCNRNSISVNKEVATANKLRNTHAPDSKRALKSEGDTRIECGRLVMKDAKGNWKSAARVIYEKKYGNIPGGNVVMVLDGNNANISDDNIVSVPLRYLGLLSMNNLRSECAEITKTGIMWCDLHELIEGRSKT